MGVLAGMLVTVLIQSSSGTTALTVGLVSAGFMTLRQAIGVIMGANIGTTVTAFIIGIKIGEYALPIMAVELSYYSSLKIKSTFFRSSYIRFWYVILRFRTNEHRYEASSLFRIIPRING